MITGREIGERFIRAVQIAERLYHVGNGPSGRAAWPLYNYTQADKNGWGTERLAAERQAFWNSLNHAPKRWEISQAEETQTWLRFVDDENERLCLVSWARCMASNAFFQDWCRSQRISRENEARRAQREEAPARGCIGSVDERLPEELQRRVEREDRFPVLVRT
jgi:hypothetical protein